MGNIIPQSHQDLLEEEKKAFAHLACHLEDGSILVNPLWFHVENGTFLINSATDRLKVKALRRNPAITLCISDPGDPYRYLEIRGKVTEFISEGAEEFDDWLTRKYTGPDGVRHKRPGEVRVTYRIVPEKAIGYPFAQP